MESFLMYFLFVVGIVLIVKGGDWFVDGAVWVAEVTRIPKFPPSPPLRDTVSLFRASAITLPLRRIRSVWQSATVLAR